MISIVFSALFLGLGVIALFVGRYAHPEGSLHSTTALSVSSMFVLISILFSVPALLTSSAMIIFLCSYVYGAVSVWLITDLLEGPSLADWRQYLTARREAAFAEMQKQIESDDMSGDTSWEVKY